MRRISACVPFQFTFRRQSPCSSDEDDIVIQNTTRWCIPPHSWESDDRGHSSMAISRRHFLLTGASALVTPASSHSANETASWLASRVHALRTIDPADDDFTD